MTRAKMAVAAGVLTLAAGLVIALRKPEPAAAETTAIPRERRIRPDPAGERQLADATVRRSVDSDWNDLLAWLDSAPPPGAEQIRERLLALRSSWSGMDPHALGEVIGRLLETGGDAETGMDFQVGRHGLLAGWPTLRVFLLDVLAISDPEMATRIARGILDSTVSADEFAVGMRSLTRPGLGRAPDAELLSRFSGMLGRDDWHGSRGFAEAMDLPRLLGSAAAAAELAAWQGNPALKTMALDEFAAQHPGAMLEVLTNDVEIDPQVRAELMARADPREPGQMEQVEIYLNDPARSDAEIEAFLKAFPLRSSTTGHRLYGGTPAPYDFHDIAAADLAARERVSDWMKEPGLVKHRPGLLRLQQRLDSWIEDAKQ